MNPDTKASTILIVDDDRTVIEQLLIHFRRRNYEPIATADSNIVEQTLKAFKVDLMLLDLRMEGLDGYDVLEKLRKQNINVPILIITAYYKSEKEHLEKVGISRDDVIDKPFQDFALIEERINKKLNKVVVPGEVGSDYENKIYLANRTKLVIADDEMDITDFLKELFEARQYQVKTFEKGDEALDYILKNECHVAIIDMKIPRVAGHYLIQRALQAKPNLKVIPFSAAYADELQEALREIGFDPTRLVTKPFDVPTLVEKVKVLATEAGTLGVRPVSQGK